MNATRLLRFLPPTFFALATLLRLYQQGISTTSLGHSLVDASSIISKNAYPRKASSGSTAKRRKSKQRAAAAGLKQCSSEQLAIINKQLPPDDCESFADRPRTQRCSFSYATRCPDSVWIDEYYTQQLLKRNQKDNTQQSFVGIFVGCNKGMDAINTLRMGSGNSFFNKTNWINAMNMSTDDDGVCHQSQPRTEFQLLEDADVKPDSSSQVFCIEPMPATYRALSNSASTLGYDTNGFTVTHAAMSKEDGIVQFPNSTKTGKEQHSMEHCADPNIDCIDIPMYSLDTYVSEFVSKDLPIDYLSVDVEGFDQDVLLGGRNTLSRVHYLEFEYNFMGSWRNQTLSHLINLLDEKYQFTCYWPGLNRAIWRITGCWLDHYDIQFWSNVACVNRNIDEAKDIADRMEDLFHKTLERGDDLIMNFENRKKLKAWRHGQEYVEPTKDSIEARLRRQEKRRESKIKRAG